MENKKGGFQNQNTNVTPLPEGPHNEPALKHPHQHNTAPQHLRVLQYGLKIPNHQHLQINQPPGFQTLNSPLHTHVHHLNQQVQYQPSHRHLQPSPQYNNINIHQNFSLPPPQKYVHPHQKINNQQTQALSPLPVCSQITQNTPQIWVPYQPPPIHYHQKPQTTQKAEAQKPSNQPAVPVSQSKPKEVVERKKSSGTIQIRSPAAKRPPEAPVTMQGWLHKQGSEGLMLWKKRWFVLSEYCLFYYKGIEEDKLLGSILLPSYKVSICKPEEKISKKFAFKCEHANMRTYILAADSQELMMQWVRVLSLASMLQTPIEGNQSSSIPESSLQTIPNQSFDSSESSNNPYGHRQNNYKTSSTPIHTQSASNCTTEAEADADAEASSSQQDQSQLNQPLYANAPPKPRRLNDGFSSPSPDFLDRYNKPNYIEPTYESRPVAKSPSIYGHTQAYRNIQPDCCQHYQHCVNDSMRGCTFTPTRDMHMVHSAERRTPDTYGRSKLHPGDFQRPTDYEDIYDEQSRYKRPLSPVAYSHVVRRSNNPPAVTPVYRAYTPVGMIGPVEHPHFIPPQTRKMPAATITRPHSADFLEYEMNRQPNSLATRQQPRPKSSLDINSNVNDNDNYFYSEEQYANKMRNSAQYLQKIPTKLQSVHGEINTKTAPIRRYQENENTFPLMRSNTQPINFNVLHISDTPPDGQPVRSRSVLSEGSLSKELDMELGSRHIDRGVSTEYAARDIYGTTGAKNRDYDPFIRSASARLAQNSPQPMYPLTMEEKHLSRDGERKREESMRRLLEWKQRMLQSPLNRKFQQGNKINHLKHPDNYHLGENGYILQQQQQPHPNFIRRPGPEQHLNERQIRNVIPQYTSYSSDDEEIVETSKDNVQSQAGRTLDTFSSKTESPSLAQTPPNTTLDNTFKDAVNNFAHVKHLHNAPYPTACEKHWDEEVEQISDGTLTQPLKQFSRDASHVAHVSSLRSEYSDKFEQSPMITEMKSNGASVKKILAEFQKESNDETEKPSTPEQEKSNADTVIEENYMPMSPKKSILAPRSSITSDTTTILKELDTEENHYVEMTQNAMGSILVDSTDHNLKNEQQSYEMVCFSGGKMEPVYMELKNPEQLRHKAKRELPDILIQSRKSETQSNKSDSSDADDEASKDLDSLDTPSQPRFSLSDTFRPASYYLGATRAGPELHDSSDSELVSPPPIPPYPPPSVTMTSTEEYTFCVSKVLQSEQSKKLQTHRTSDQFYNINTETMTSNSSNKIEIDKGVSFNRSFPIEESDKDKTNSSRLPQTNDSDIELRFSNSTGYDTDSLLKRRPVSEEFCSELASLDGTFVEDSVQSTDIERYINDLPICNTSMASNDDTSLNVRINTTTSTTVTGNLSYYEYENIVMRGFANETDLSKFSDISVNVFEDDYVTRKDLNTAHIFSVTPGSSKSTSIDISSLRQNSCCSTPVVDMDFLNDNNKDISVAMYIAEQTDQSFCTVPAPYYYSDLNISMANNTNPALTLNNQRESSNGNKRDITHIINPIKCNSLITTNPMESLDNTFKLAAEARSASVDFLNLTDKSGSIDEKNIYESNTLKWQKTTRTNSSLAIDPTVRNLYPSRHCDKFSTSDSISTETVRRSQSLEGFLDNVITQTPGMEESGEAQEANQESFSTNLEGSYVWEEDSIWRERLRSASQRHTKSMEDLDTIGDESRKKKKPARGITRGVTYVNDNFLKFEKQNETKEEKELKNDNDKKEGNFIIDREKLRQWDLLSSAPSDDQLSTVTAIQAHEGSNIVVETGEGNCDSPDIAEPQEPASGSVSINTRDMSRINARDTFPRAISAKKVWATHIDPRSVPNTYRGVNKDQYGDRNSQSFYVNRAPSYPELDPDARKENWPINDKINVSAGELLGRTHEELVLLLIQLRRRSSQTLQAIENCYNEIDTIQANLQAMTDQARRMENLQKLEQIKKHLLELEKQYEKGKPLVNLVDNMVKLGSLYRVPTDRHSHVGNIRDKLHFNQQVQERRLLSEEKRDWDRVNPDHFHFQEKVQQLYQLDRLIQEESGTLQNLQQDKEDIEQALGGLRRRLNKGLNDPAEIEHARQQQIMLENELSRVHLMLAQNSKKLEETVAGNARLEQELLVLKQKLQNSKQQRSSQQYSNAGDSLTCAMDNSVTLESDLQRVQKKVGELQKQRQELSMQVKQLTDRSSNLTPQKTSSPMQNNQWNKKKIPSLWRETDLDTMNIVDHGDSSEHSRSVNSSTTPLYINADINQLRESEYYSNRNTRSNDSTSDSTSISSNLPHEKQEIKTVRIIKRESERRQRDREKSSTGRSEILLEEDDSSQCSSVLFRPAPVQKVQSATSLIPCPYEADQKLLTGINSVSSPNLPQCFDREVTSSEEVSTDKSPEMSPVFKSEAARQIITEISDQEPPKQYNRRAIPKEKRRHYTAPHNHLLMKSLNQLSSDSNAFDRMVFNTRRARDDMDMERALRQRIDAPDVVRSTLSSKELKYNENTIDNILGTPNKINIPERYIPEQLPQLSAEEQEYRLKKVESIKKMLSDTAIISSSSSNLNTEDKEKDESSSSSIMNKATSKMIEEKKQREHLLQLNQILAKQVMEMSKIVAGVNPSDENN